MYSNSRNSLLLAGLLSVISGCVTAPYQYGMFTPVPGEEEKPAEVVVDVGVPNKTLDRIGWVVGFPSRIFPLHAGVNNHQVSDETRNKVTHYLRENDLTDVRVRINHYDPKDEWRRTVANHRIAPGWRYTSGLLSYLHYTLLPGRIIGGDWYNPYSNSLYINSDVQALVLHEAAYAKDVHSRRLPGTYSAINHIPLLWLWRQTVCVNDILSYSRAEGDWEVEKETYLVVFPLIGAHTGMAPSPLGAFGYEPLLGLGGALVGHATGRSVAAYREHDILDHPSTPPMEPPPAEEIAKQQFPAKKPTHDRASDLNLDIEHTSLSITNTRTRK